MSMRKIVVLGDNEAWGDLAQARVCEVPEKDVLNGPPSPEDYKKRSRMIERGELQAAYLAGVPLETIMTYFRSVVQELHDMYGPDGPEDTSNGVSNQDSHLYPAENLLMEIDGTL